jgi:acetoin utilization deacetylase AcuC-like enzyme
MHTPGQTQVSRTKLEVCCTVKAARLALEHGVALSCAGGTHHAHRNWGSGFTVRAKKTTVLEKC